MMKLATRLVLRYAIYSYLFMIGFALSSGIFSLLSYRTFPSTYIQQINTPTYGNEWSKDVLREFNQYGNNEIIQFSEIEGGRPVTIEEMDDSVIFTVLYNEAIGLTFSTLNGCKIYLRKGMSYVNFRETLIHEYLHCMNYDHSPDARDIMYYRLNPGPKEENIRAYAQDLKDKYYGK